MARVSEKNKNEWKHYRMRWSSSYVLDCQVKDSKAWIETSAPCAHLLYLWDPDLVANRAIWTRLEPGRREGRAKGCRYFGRIEITLMKSNDSEPEKRPENTKTWKRRKKGIGQQRAVHLGIKNRGL